MDSEYIVLDYRRISDEHEFYKNIHRLTEFLTRGFVWESAGQSLCTPGDIRTRYQVWESPTDPVSVLASRNGDRLVPLKVQEGDEAFFVRKGKHDRRQILELETGDLLWWRNLWRVLFLIAAGIAGAVQYRASQTNKLKK